jgi:hypothetical protein
LTVTVPVADCDTEAVCPPLPLFGNREVEGYSDVLGYGVPEVTLGYCPVLGWSDVDG